MSRFASAEWAIVAVAALSVLAPKHIPNVSPIHFQTQDNSVAFVPATDYPVYNAILADIEFSRLKPVNQIHALIVNDTLNLGCGAESKNPIMLNDCSPMLMPPTTTDDLHKILKDEFHLNDALWADWTARNAKSWRLQDQFKTIWTHGLTGDGIDPATLSAPEWKNADCAFYFSRVGFDESKKQAIVFVFYASYLDRAPSSGDYFFLKQHENGAWKIDGRLNYFNTTKDAIGN